MSVEEVKHEDKAHCQERFITVNKESRVEIPPREEAGEKAGKPKS
jgi:hypothetical protein